MTVYVDCGRRPFGRMLMSHMLADTPAELHAMARAIGLKRRWFQPGSSPHYDVCQQKRLEAINRGAAVVTNRELVAVIRRLRG